MTMATIPDTTRDKGTAEAPLHFSAEHHFEPTRSNSVVIHNAKTASDKEQKMTLLEGIKLYPKAIGWSILISTCICMEGYDVCLLRYVYYGGVPRVLAHDAASNFYGFPQFNKKYGEYVPSDGTYQVPARWQAGLSNGANCGEIIGLFLNGWVSERFGYRYTVMTCLVFVTAFIAIFFTAQNVVALQVAEVLCGVSCDLSSSTQGLS